MRNCTKCGRPEGIVEFQSIQRADRKSPSVIQPCKECRSKARKKRYKKNVTAARQKSQRWREGNREHLRELQRSLTKKYRKQVLDHYGPHCICCGEDEEAFLTIDHKNNDGKEHRRSVGAERSGQQFYRWIVKNGFPDDLQILCWNCNSAKGQRGVCPHQERRGSQAESTSGSYRSSLLPNMRE